MTNRAEVVEFEGPDGKAIAIEVNEPKLKAGVRPISRANDKDIISYQEAIDRVKPAAEYLLQTIGNLEAAPKSVEVSFGIKLSTKAGAIIASASAEGNFSVKLVWSRN